MKVFSAILVSCVGVVSASAFSTTAAAARASFASQRATITSRVQQQKIVSRTKQLPSLRARSTNSDPEINTGDLPDRRSVLLSTLTTSLLSSFIRPFPAMADPTSAPAITSKELLARLRGVPCFAIVDKDGVPYMIVDKNARGATGYFFLTFRGALSVLGDAVAKAREEGYEQLWADAKITTVPLDIALRLSLKKLERKGQNDISMDTIVDLLPGMDERNDALKLDSSGMFNEQGRVPLFYVSEGMEAEDGSLPVYFSKETLTADWDRLYAGKKPIPQVKVIDLLDLFQKTMRGSSNLNVAFVPTEETMKVAVELQSRKLTAPYKTDRMVMVGGKG